MGTSIHCTIISVFAGIGPENFASRFPCATVISRDGIRSVIFKTFYITSNGRDQLIDDEMDMFCNARHQNGHEVILAIHFEN